MPRSRLRAMEAILTILCPVLFVALLVLERIFPARQLPKVRFWLVKGILFFFVSGAVGAMLPVIANKIVGTHALFDLRGLGMVGGAIVAYIVADLFGYAAHRFLHNVPFIWRYTHQMHHSAERIDVATANYSHPLDILVMGTPPLLAVSLLGVSAEAAALVGFLNFAIQTFQHVNMRTPRWVGWIVQRPEAHAVHHARGVHAYNYGTLALWDLVFGTYRNPTAFGVDPAGFWDGASTRIGAMLIGRDVSEP